MRILLLLVILLYSTMSILYSTVFSLYSTAYSMLLLGSCILNVFCSVWLYSAAYFMLYSTAYSMLLLCTRIPHCILLYCSCILTRILSCFCS